MTLGKKPLDRDCHVIGITEIFCAVAVGMAHRLDDVVIAPALAHGIQIIVREYGQHGCQRNAA